MAVEARNFMFEVEAKKSGCKLAIRIKVDELLRWAASRIYTKFWKVQSPSIVASQLDMATSLISSRNDLDH